MLQFLRSSIRTFVVAFATFLPSFAPLFGQTVETMQAFTNGPRNPSDGLVLGPDGAAYGTTTSGGSYGKGTLYRMSESGGFTVLHDFNDVEGSTPGGGLLLAADGNFYGVTCSGGTNNVGTIFRVTTQGNLTVLRHLDTASGTTLSGPMVQDGDGMLHGNFKSGGTNNQGAVFNIRTDGTGFASSLCTTSTGYDLTGSPAIRPDGVYGAAREGGLHGGGTVYKRSGGTLQAFKSFTSTETVGTKPQSLIFASDGYFYGFSFKSGTNSRGHFFRMTTEGVLSSITNVPVDNSMALASVVVGSDNQLYGYFQGNEYAYRIALGSTPAFTLLGRPPVYFSGNLLRMPNGSVYGTVSIGSDGNNGCVYKLTASGIPFEIISIFGEVGGNTPKSLMQSRDQTFLGTLGTPSATGVVAFGLTPEAKFSAFPSLPSVPLETGPDKGLYGLSNGKFFRADPLTKEVTLEIPLITGINASSPGLCLASDGNFYGTSSKTIFRITPAGTQTVLTTVSNQGSVWYPEYRLTEGADGMLYGVTFWGGSSASSGDSGVGTVFRVTKAGVITIVKHFTNETNAARLPLGRLVRHTDGNLYGMTAVGGTLAKGTIFRIPPNGSYTHVLNMGDTGYEFTNRGLALRADNAFYGIYESGGSATVFRVTSAGVASSVANLSPLNASGYYSQLITGSDNSLYGVVENGGNRPDGSFAGGGAVFRIRFGPRPKTESVTDVGEGTATLRGTVDPLGLNATASFQWATSPDFSDMRSIPAGTATATGGIQTFTVNATGLDLSKKLYVRMAATSNANATPQFGDAIEFTTLPLPANIVIENDAGFALEDGDLTEIGGTTSLKAATHIFTVRNTGHLDLTDTNITITGGSPEFTVVSQPAAVIPGGGTSTFTISFLPSSNGVKSGTFRVDSDAPYRSSIALGIQGKGFSMSTVNFATDATVHATVPRLDATGLQLGPVTLGFTPDFTTVVKLIDVTGSSPVQGHFLSMPEGSLFNVNRSGSTYPFKISYTGGDGNDVVMIRALPPSVNYNSTGITGSDGTCAFRVSRNGKTVTSMSFEYGLTRNYGSSANGFTQSEYNGNEYQTALLSGVTPGTMYYYRFVFATTDGTATLTGNFATSATIANLEFTSPDQVLVTTNWFYMSNATLDTSMTLGFNPSPNQTLTVVNQTGTSPAFGTYGNAPQDTIVTSDSPSGPVHFLLRYDGGDGNDIVLIRTYPQEAATNLTARLNESFFHSYRIYHNEFTMTGVPGWLTPTRSSDYLNFNGTPTTKGRHRIVISITGGSTIIYNLNVVEPMAQWKSRNFTPQEASDPQISGNMVDASGHGVPNLMKFALGIPPKSDPTGKLPTLSLQPALNEQYLTLTYRQDPHAEGMTCVVETSDRLGSWHTDPFQVVEISRTPNPDGTETVVVWDRKPVKAGASRFMRLKVNN